MRITFKNCNNIDNGVVSIEDSKLNIIFGNNGSGKSTIANAFIYNAEGANSILKLKPFKLIESGDANLKPEVVGAEAFKKVLVFNEGYLSQFLFKPDELISNSFEVFIRTSKYEEGIKNINLIISNVKDVFNTDQDLNVTISNLEELSKSCKSTQKGISKSSDIYRSFGGGNKVGLQ